MIKYFELAIIEDYTLIHKEVLRNLLYNDDKVAVLFLRMNTGNHKIKIIFHKN